MFDFQGKTVAISGGATGIGRQITERFYKAGANVAMCSIEGDYKPEILQEIAGGDDKRIWGMAADLTDNEQRKAFIDGVYEKFGQLDILVNNVGIFIKKDNLEFTEEDWDKTMNVNLKSHFFLSQYVLKKWVDNKLPGVLISTASINAKFPVVDTTAYCISKAGVAMMTKCFAKDFGKYNIRVNAVGPGSIPTGINAELDSDPKATKELEQSLPMRRQGTTDEIASGVLFLASDEASYITGQTLFIEGGYML